MIELVLSRMSIPFPPPLEPVPDDLSSVQMGEGPPTLGELAKFYPARHTWEELKAFMRTGDLSLLKRDPVLQKRYVKWAQDIKGTYGTITNYLLQVRLGWGTPLTSNNSPAASAEILSSIATTTVPYFTSNITPENVKIIFNDWPYSIPLDISHYVVWTRLPIVHPDIVHPSVMEQVHHDGLWGFSGGHPEEHGSIDGQWGDVAPNTSAEARAHILNAGQHTHDFVTAHWPPHIWEVAWFVNPPRIQSVKDLTHIHVFARRKITSQSAS